MSVISPITRQTSAVVGLEGSTRKPYLIKILFMNIGSPSSACFSSSNFLCLILLDFLFPLRFFLFYFLFAFDVAFFEVLVIRVLVLGSAGWLDFPFYDFLLYLDPFSLALDGWPTRPWHEEFFLCSFFSVCVI